MAEAFACLRCLWMSTPRGSTEASATPRAHPHGTGAPAMPNIEKVCFDRVLPAELTRPLAGRMLSMSIGRTRAAFQIAKMWPTGSTIRILFLGGTSQQQALVNQPPAHWAQYTNLAFTLLSSGNSQVDN